MGEVVNIFSRRAEAPSQMSLPEINEKIDFYRKAVNDLLDITLNPANQPERKKNEAELRGYLKNLDVWLQKRKALQQASDGKASADKKVS